MLYSISLEAFPQPHMDQGPPLGMIMTLFGVYGVLYESERRLNAKLGENHCFLL